MKLQISLSVEKTPSYWIATFNKKGKGFEESKYGKLVGAGLSASEKAKLKPAFDKLSRAASDSANHFMSTPHGSNDPALEAAVVKAEADMQAALAAVLGQKLKDSANLIVFVQNILR